MIKDLTAAIGKNIHLFVLRNPSLDILTQAFGFTLHCVKTN